MDETVELLVAAYDDLDTADTVLETLKGLQRNKEAQVITAVALRKDVQGKTTVAGTLEAQRKKGTRYGALAGGLLTLLAPPVGAAGILVGAVVGAATGRALTKKPERNFTQDFLREILGGMRGGTSAVVVLVERTQAERVVDTLTSDSVRVVRLPLSEQSADQLAAVMSPEESASPQATVTADALVEQVKELLAGSTRRGPQFQRVRVIINPGAGRDVPILNTLNTVFSVTGVQWDVAITHKAGDARRLAQEAESLGFDLVATYGGDGTVMETASGLIGSDLPLVILPGGTNNVLSVELGIPKDLVEAAALVGGVPAELRTIDMGRANDHYFILRVGIGYEAAINEGASREMKDRFGGFAYTLAGLRALRNPPVARYRLQLDEETAEMDGLWCLVANSASLGIAGVNLVQGCELSDGLLDVIMVRQADLDSLVSVALSVANLQTLGKRLPHWQVRRVTVTADPPQAVTGDGELWEPTPLQAEVIPGAVKILVPISA